MESIYPEPRQQEEPIWEIRNSPELNLQVTFLASARAEAGQPDCASSIDLLLATQHEVPSMTGPPASSALSTQGDGKSQNINLDMQGVVDWGSFMDILDSSEKEILEPKRALDRPPMATTLPTIGAGKEGKWIHKGQAEASGSSSAVATPRKEKLPESMGAQPKTTTLYPFASQDI